jgi:uncharacterized protein YajQ (UPF0234 family)
MAISMLTLHDTRSVLWRFGTKSIAARFDLKNRGTSFERQKDRSLRTIVKAIYVMTFF